MYINKETAGLIKQLLDYNMAEEAESFQEMLNEKGDFIPIELMTNDEIIELDKKESMNHIYAVILRIEKSIRS